MSGYGSAYKGYPTYNGSAPQTDPWSKASYASDHVCKPVVVDAEGRKHPIVYNPGCTTEATITKTETVVQQQFHLPFSTEYKHSSHTKIEPLIHHGYVEDKWHQSSSPVHDRPHKVEEFFTTVQTEVIQPKKFGLLSPSYWRQSPNSAGYHGSSNTGYGDYNDKSNNDWSKSSGNTIQNGNPNSTGYHRPHNTGYGDYNDKSSTDGPKPSGNITWNGNPNSTGYHGPGNTGYGDYNDESSKDWPKSSGNTIRNGNPSSTGYHEPSSTRCEDYNDISSKDWPKPSGNAIRSRNPNSTGYNGPDNTSYENYNDMSSKDWPKPSGNTIRSGNPNSTYYNRPGNTGYENYNDKSSNNWSKPSANTIRNGNNDGNYHNQNNDSKMEPTMNTSGGWAAPLDTALSRPTNDIGTAVEFLKEASKPTPVTTSPHSRYPVPITTGHKTDGYGVTIDSREASKRYGHFPASFQSEEKYKTTIDSREAARKYKGAAVPM